MVVAEARVPVRAASIVPPSDNSLKILTAIRSCGVAYFSCADLRRLTESDVMGQKTGLIMDGTTTPGFTSSLCDKARYFHSLHVRGQPLVLFNIWDAGSEIGRASCRERVSSPV